MRYPLDIITPPSVYWNSFLLLYKDLEETFRFVTPTKEHFSVYSFRYYDLLLRAATEFESICKDKLVELKLSNKGSDAFNIIDYHLLNAHFQQKPSGIRVGFLFSDPLFVHPLENWSTTHSLPWYQQYNEVKHNRANLFKNANLSNVLDAIGALFIMIERSALCPKGKLAVMQSSDAVLMRNHPEWPVIIQKLYK